MKLTAENIKHNYQILIIKLLIIILFILSLINGFNSVSEYYYAFSDYGNNKLSEFISISINRSFLRPALILLIPLIGIFIGKKIGWILILSYLYFLISNLVFQVKFVDLTEKTLILIYIFGISALLLIIILMNKSKISNLTYGIAKTELISMNIIASTIGMSITIIRVIL